MPDRKSFSALSLLLGCSDPEQPFTPVDLLSAEAWTLVPLEQDPFDPPPEASCAEVGVQVESGALEILTDRCAWATLTQPLAAGVPEGDRLELFAFHGTLVAPEPALGVMTLHAGERLLWSIEVPIPSDDGIYLDEWVLPAPLEQGETMTLHVHNHGANSWRFVSLKDLGPDTAG